MKIQTLPDSSEEVFEYLYPRRFAYDINGPSLVRAVLTETIWLTYQTRLIPPDQSCQVRG